MNHRHDDKRATTAETAAMIRKELKATWPDVAFSARSREHSTVYVSYTDGPTEAAVSALLKKYEGGYFDGMEDIYRHTGPYLVDGVDYSVKYVLVTRHHSDEAWAAFREVYCAWRGDLDGLPGYEVDTLVGREIRQWDATKEPLPATADDLPGVKQYRQATVAQVA